MKGTYYKPPIDFKALIEKHDLAKTTLETSIDQQLFLLATTAWGECKFDEFTIGGKEEGKNFPTLHKVIHQVKSWIRGIYSWVSEFNIDRYLAEYSFRINRSQSKETIFNSLIKRMLEREPIFQPLLICH